MPDYLAGIIAVWALVNIIASTNQIRLNNAKLKEMEKE